MSGIFEKTSGKLVLRIYPRLASLFVLVATLATNSSAAGALVAHWTYDTVVPGATTADSATVEDIAGSNDVGLLGSIDSGRDPEAISGVIGAGALRFDGSLDNVFVVNSAEINSATGAAQSRTFSVWFNTSSNNIQQIVEKGSNEQFVMQTDSGTTLTWRISSSPGPDRVQDMSGVLNGAWHHMVGTYDGVGEVITLYVDGALVGTSSVSSPPADNTSGLIVGADGGLGSAYTGDLDDMAIWNNELTAIEALALFDLGDETALNYNASEVQSMFTAFAGTTDVTVDGTFWEYQASGIVGVEGEVNNLGGGDFSINLGGGAGFATGTASATNGVPEPASAALLLIAIASMAALRRHTRRSA